LEWTWPSFPVIDVLGQFDFVSGDVVLAPKVWPSHSIDRSTDAIGLSV
jgi:hypothetical protein